MTCGLTCRLSCGLTTGLTVDMYLRVDLFHYVIRRRQGASDERIRGCIG